MNTVIFESDWNLSKKDCLAVLPYGNVFVLNNERDFMRFLGQFRDCIDLAIINLMGRWQSGEQTVCEPDDVLQGGVENAGFRCVELVRQHSPSAKIIIFTFFDEECVLSRAEKISDAVVRSTLPGAMAEAVAKVAGKS